MARGLALSACWRIRRALTPNEVASQLAALGVEAGGLLLVHTSYRAVLAVDGENFDLIDRKTARHSA